MVHKYKWYLKSKNLETFHCLDTPTRGIIGLYILIQRASVYFISI